MTVGLAATCFWGAPANAPTVVCASDRMITSGDVEFEPPAAKIYQLTNSQCMLIAGDAAAQKEIWRRVRIAIGDRLSKDQSWMHVFEMANIVSWNIVVYTQERVERTVLQPLRLDYPTFVSRQREMRPEFFAKVSKEMDACRPDIQTLVAGIDPTGAHIYELDAWGDIKNSDAAAFAAIGAGQRHAESQFMFAKHGISKNFPETLMLTYTAKRRAETAPGVGNETDMCVIAGLGNFVWIHSNQLKELKRFYEAYVRRTERAAARADKDIAEHFKKLAAAAEAQQVGAQAPPAVSVTTSPPVTGEAATPSDAQTSTDPQ